MSAGEFCQTKKSEGRKEGEAIELYPKGGLMTIHSEKFSDKGLENNVGKSVMRSDKFSDKGLENYIGKLRNSTQERREGEMEEITIEMRSRDEATLRLERVKQPEFIRKTKIVKPY